MDEAKAIRPGRGVLMRIKVGKIEVRAALLFAIAGLIVPVAAIMNRGRSASRESHESVRAKLSPSCRLVLVPLSTNAPIDQETSQQQSRILNGSPTVPDFDRLGWLFVKKARLAFDPGYYKLAEQCARCIDSLEPQSPEALLLKAHVAQSLHRFSEAEELATRLTKLRERPFDYAVLGDALIDQGKIREGAAAYQKMVDLRPDLQSYVRAAHVRWLTGDLQGAVQLMQLAISSSSPNDPNNAAWAFNRLGLYQLQLGATRDALRSCDAALSLQSDYAPALFTRARVLWTFNRFEEALAQFKLAAELNPLPEYQWALADAMRATNSTGADEVELSIKRSTDDPRTISLYLSTRGENLGQALELAEQELRNRQDVFTRDALAWASVSSGRITDASREIQKALAEGTKDSRLYLHAAVIAAQNGQHKQAKRWIGKADATRQMLFPSERDLLRIWRERILTSKGDQTS